MDVVEKARIIAKKSCPSCGAEFAAEDNARECPNDHTPLESASKEKDPLVGTVIADRYEILEMIGSGGWALIYKAKQRPLNRLVAIKILHGHLAGDPEKVKRFKREAEAATKLVHENVGSVFDYGVLSEGQPYMVMEYLQGITLQDILKRDKKVEMTRAIELFREICSGLALAHERGIVHRDIKPSNIYMVNNESQAKILDFGLAKLLMPDDPDASTSLTQTGQTIGTPSYMSPEQCTGFPLDARSDLYSVGCVMFEALSGKRAFEGRNLFETMSQQINSEPSFEAAEASEVPPDLQLVVMKALAKDPQERFQSAKDLDAALEAVLVRLRGDGGGILWARVRALYHKQKRASKRLLREPMVAVVVASSVLLAAFASWCLLRGNDKPTPIAITSDIGFKKHLAEGQRKFDKAKFEAAASLFNQAARESASFGEADPRHLEALQRQADALRRAGKADESIKVDQAIAGIWQRYTGSMYGDETENAQKIAQLDKKLKAQPGDRTVAQQLCSMRNKQAELMLTNSRFEDAQLQLDKAMALENSLLGTQTAEYATSLSCLGYIYANNDEPARAEQAYKEALALREKLLGPSDPFVAKSLRNLGDFYLKHGKYAEAERLLERSMAIYQKFGTEADAAWDLNNLGAVYLQEKQFAKAQVAFERALQMRQQINKDNPDYIDVGRTLHNIAMLKQAQGNLREAVVKYEDALRIYETQLSPTHSDTLKCAMDLANAYMQQQDFKRAEPLLKRVVGVTDVSEPLGKQAATSLQFVENKLRGHG